MLQCNEHCATFYYILILHFCSCYSLLIECKTIRDIQSDRVIEKSYDSIELQYILLSMRPNSIYSRNCQELNEYDFIAYSDPALYRDQDKLNIDIFFDDTLKILASYIPFNILRHN